MKLVTPILDGMTMRVGRVGLAGVLALACSSACSSSSSGGTSDASTFDVGVATTKDAGTTAQKDSGSAKVDAPVEAAASHDTGATTPETGTSVDTGAPCEKPPSLHPQTAPGVYCPFSAPPGGSNLTCAAGQHCCETPASASTPSTCEAASVTTCPVAGSVDWECTSPIDCAGNDAGAHVCCGTGTATTATHCAVTWPEFSGFSGSKCVTACAAPSFTVCEIDADCATAPGGKTCTASKESGGQVGFCN